MRFWPLCNHRITINRSFKRLSGSQSVSGWKWGRHCSSISLNSLHDFDGDFCNNNPRGWDSISVRRRCEKPGEYKRFIWVTIHKLLFFSCSSLPFHNIESSMSLFLNRSRVEKGEQISRLVGWFKGGKMLVVDGSRWQKIYTKINTALSTVKASFDEWSLMISGQSGNRWSGSRNQRLEPDKYDAASVAIACGITAVSLSIRICAAVLLFVHDFGSA